MTPNTILAGMMLVSLIVYALLAGADYGAGFWDLLSFGPNRERQRDLIAHAIEPAWETNHVWLILLIVLMFAGFPAAFTSMTVNLAVPLYLIPSGLCCVAHPSFSARILQATSVCSCSGAESSQYQAA